jgi:hypothetical protein
MLSCKHTKRERAKELFKIVEDFMKEKACSGQIVLEYARLQFA